MNKTLFLYWGGRNLSWLRYLTVVSFNKHNPEWVVKVYYPTEPNEKLTWSTGEQGVTYNGKDWFNDLSNYAELIPLDIEKIGGSNSMAEVHKSDIFRLWVLHKYGGVYCDFDILYTKPLPTPTERWFCYHPDGHYSIGLLAADKGDGICRWLLESIQLRTDREKYQSFGSSLWQAMLDGSTLEGWNMPEDFIYSFNWTKVEDLFRTDKKLPRGAVGIHWYGGSEIAGQWENLLTPKTYKDHISTITNIIKGIL